MKFLAIPWQSPGPLIAKQITLECLFFLGFGNPWYDAQLNESFKSNYIALERWQN